MGFRSSLLDGVYNGFRVVDPDVEIPVDDCKNYNSCFEGDNAWKMANVLNKELAEGKLTVTIDKPE